MVAQGQHHQGEVLSLPETCRVLGLGYFRVYGLILTKRLPAVQDRKRHWWIDRTSVEQFQRNIKNATSGKTRRSHNSGDGQGRHRVATGT